MNYKVETIQNFDKEAKRLSRKYKSLKSEIARLISQLEKNPITGTHLGNNVSGVTQKIKKKLCCRIYCPNGIAASHVKSTEPILSMGCRRGADRNKCGKGGRVFMVIRESLDKDNELIFQVQLLCLKESSTRFDYYNAFERKGYVLTK